jgi:hypothetical protein
VAPVSDDLQAFSDDELRKFESEGAAPLPASDEQGYVDNEGARIWYAAYGGGSPVILLHGGLGMVATGAIRYQPWLQTGTGQF